MQVVIVQIPSSENNSSLTGTVKEKHSLVIINSGSTRLLPTGSLGTQSELVLKLLQLNHQVHLFCLKPNSLQFVAQSSSKTWNHLTFTVMKAP